MVSFWQTWRGLAVLISSCLLSPSSNWMILSSAFQPRPMVLMTIGEGKRLGRRVLLSLAENDEQSEAERLRAEAEKLREQIKKMEDSLGERRPRGMPPEELLNDDDDIDENAPMTLKKRRVLVVGANGRLGSMVCRYLLRNHPQTEVVAACHVIGEDSTTARGYGRLQYEVGAEDGIGNIGAAWSGEDRVATFEYADYMKDFNLQNIRLVEVELLDPVQCDTICEGVDSVIWCATDFNGNKPRAVSGLNVAFLFRAVADPTKGRVEIEGLRNLLSGFKRQQTQGKWESKTSDVMAVFQPSKASLGKDPTNFVLVSTAPEAFRDFETPFGTFKGLKREGEAILEKEFPSISYSILQMAKYEDNFVEENMDVIMEDAAGHGSEDAEEKRRRINRRDAARTAVEALTNPSIAQKKVQVWTAIR